MGQVAVLLTFSLIMWRRNKTGTEAVGFFSAIIHWEQSRVTLYKVSLSVSGSSGAQWVIPLLTQLQGVTGPLGINMSHTEAETNDGVVLWRRLEMEMQTISPVLSDSLMNSYSAMPMHSKQMTSVALCHRTAVSFTSWTHTAKVTFEFLCFATILYVTVCCIMQEELPFFWTSICSVDESGQSTAFGAFWDVLKREGSGGIKDMCSATPSGLVNSK